MENEVLNHFKPSFLRCVSNLLFLDTFYTFFLEASHEVEEVFEGINMERQKAMLNASLHQLVNVYEKRGGEAMEHIKELGARHGRHGYRIPDHLYDLWLDSLIRAVARCDRVFDKNIEAAWREVMLYGISLMKEHAQQPVRTIEKEVLKDSVGRIQRNLESSAKEASKHADSERDMEARAFQFGQYRAYLHAADLVRSLLRGIESREQLRIDE